ncbi:MAG: hypothetical protein DRQ39_09870 [Gammaproteobacteria bacterium]|nr:MAG: hypothetical protein DRQ39_09870 [Gammaproteobacteria bacterium]
MAVATETRETTLVHQVGFLAGDVYRYLYETGEASLNDLKKELGTTPAMLQMAVGWLAREEKIVLSKKGAGYLVKLNA